MKTPKFLFIAAAFLAPSAHAAWVVKAGILACNKSINEWGQSSQCNCPEATTYNQKIGLCLQGEVYPIMVQGVLRTDAPSLGRPLSGIALETEFGRFDLVVKDAEKDKLNKANGLFFEVSGEFIILPEVDTSKHMTIIVDTISWLE